MAYVTRAMRTKAADDAREAQDGVRLGKCREFMRQAGVQAVAEREAHPEYGDLTSASTLSVHRAMRFQSRRQYEIYLELAGALLTPTEKASVESSIRYCGDDK